MKTPAELLKTDPETLDAGELRQWLAQLRLAAGSEISMDTESGHAFYVGVARMAKLLDCPTTTVRRQVKSDVFHAVYSNPRNTQS